MKKNRLCGTILAIVVLSVIFVPLLVKIVQDFCRAPEEDGLYIFSDIDELEKIQERSDMTVKRYDTPGEDKRLKSLDYENFFAAEIAGGSFKFKIYAYEFKSVDDTQKYFKNVTGKEASGNSSFSSSFGPYSGNRIVIEDEKAYVFYCSSFDEYHVIDLLNEIFTVKVELGE